MPATGFSIGVSRLQAALSALGKLDDTGASGPVVVLVMDKERIGDYQRMVADLRRAGIPAELYLGSAGMKAQMKYADRRNAPLAIIQGGDEKARGVVQIKDLRAGKKLAARHRRPRRLARGARRAGRSGRRRDLVGARQARCSGAARAAVSRRRCTESYESLRRLFSDAGYAFVEPPVVHPASVFVETGGRGSAPAALPDQRRRRHRAGAPARLHDPGLPAPPRHRRGEAEGELRLSRAGVPHAARRAAASSCQAGVESLGRTDRVAADADMLKLAFAAADLLGVRKPTVRIGDSALFAAVLDALDLDAPWRRRLARAFGDTERLKAIHRHAPTARARRRPPARRRAGRRARQVTHAVEERFAATGLGSVGGRTADEIAERFVEKSALADGIGAARRRGAVGVPRHCRHARKVACRAPRARARREARHRQGAGSLREAHAKRSPATASTSTGSRFAADFGRRLDYYTGFVFEFHGGKQRDGPDRRRRPLRPPDGAHRRLAAKRCRRSASRSGSTGSEASHERAADPRHSVEGPAAGGHAGASSHAPASRSCPPGSERSYRGRIAGIAGVEVAYLSAPEIAREIGAGAVHAGVTGRDQVEETRAGFRDARDIRRAARLRPLRRGGRGAGGVDRRRDDGRPRRRRRRIPPAPRPAADGRDQVRQHHAPLLRRPRHRRLPHRREPRRDRRRAGVRAPPTSSSTSPRPARRSAPTG